MKKEFIVRPAYFFKDIEGFKSKDVNCLILQYMPKVCKTKYQFTGNRQSVELTETLDEVLFGK